MATVTFEPIAKTVTVPIAFTEISIQELADQIATWMEGPQNLDSDLVAEWEGKASLGGVEQVGVTLTMLNDWRILFEARPGPTTVSVQVSGGNLVAVNSFDDNPIKPSAFTQPQIRQSQAPTIISTAGITPTTEQMRAAVWDSVEGTPVASSYGARLKKILTKVLFLGN